MPLPYGVKSTLMDWPIIVLIVMTIQVMTPFKQEDSEADDNVSSRSEKGGDSEEGVDSEAEDVSSSEEGGDSEAEDMSPALKRRQVLKIPSKKWPVIVILILYTHLLNNQYCGLHSQYGHELILLLGSSSKVSSLVISRLLPSKVYLHGTSKPFPCFLGPVTSQVPSPPLPRKCQTVLDSSRGT